MASSGVSQLDVLNIISKSRVTSFVLGAACAGHIFNTITWQVYYVLLLPTIHPLLKYQGGQCTYTIQFHLDWIGRSRLTFSRGCQCWLLKDGSASAEGTVQTSCQPALSLFLSFALPILPISICSSWLGPAVSQIFFAALLGLGQPGGQIDEWQIKISILISCFLLLLCLRVAKYYFPLSSDSSCCLLDWYNFQQTDGPPRQISDC